MTDPGYGKSMVINKGLYLLIKYYWKELKLVLILNDHMHIKFHLQNVLL